MSFGLNCPPWLLTRAWLDGFVGMMVLTFRYFSAGILPALNSEFGKKLNSLFPRLLLLPASAKYRMMCSESQRFTSLSTARLKKLRVFGKICLCFVWLAAFSQKFWQVFVLTREITIVARFCFLSRQIELKNHLYRQFKAALKAEMFQFQAIHF